MAEPAPRTFAQAGRSAFAGTVLAPTLTQVAARTRGVALVAAGDARHPYRRVRVWHTAAAGTLVFLGYDPATFASGLPSAQVEAAPINPDFLVEFAVPPGHNLYCATAAAAEVFVNFHVYDAVSAVIEIP